MINKIAELEGLIYISGDNGTTMDILKKSLSVNDHQLSSLIKRLKEKYESDNSPFTLVLYADKVKLATKSELDDLVKEYLDSDDSYSLTQTALETLTIIAYNQPITRIEIDDIRGVNSSKVIQRLIDQNLIKSHGHKKVLGNPKLYVTTDYFLEIFGIKDLNELPKIDDSILIKESEE